MSVSGGVVESTQGRACESMIERIARAIGDAEVGYQIQFTRLVDGVSAYTLKYDDGSDRTLEFDYYSSALKHVQNRLREVRARAAVEAMREPTEAMQRAGFVNNRHVNTACCDRPTCIGAVTMPADKAWHAMIDAALAEASR